MTMAAVTENHRTTPPTAAPASAPKGRTHLTGRLVGVVLAAVVGLAISLFLPATGGLTPEGVNALAVIVPTIILWLTAGTGWTSLLGIALLIVAGTLTPGQAWSSSLGNPTIAMILIFSLIARALAEVGVIDSVAAWFLTRPFLRGRPHAVLATLIFSQLLLGVVMQGLALGIIYLDMVTRLCERIGVKKGHSLYTVIVQGVLWAHGVVNVSSPVGGTWPLMMIGLLAARGIDVTFGMWFAVGIPFTAIAFLVMVVCTRFAKPDVRPLLDLDLDEFTRNVPPLSKRGKLGALVTTIMLVVVLLPDLFSAFGIFTGFASWLGGLGITVPAIAAIAVMCLLKADGEPVMDYTKIVRTAPMGVLIFVGAISALSGPLGSEATGITAWLHGMLEPVLGGLSPFWVFVVALAGSVVLTNFISNGVTLTLAFTLGTAVLAGTGANIGAFGVLMTIAACLAVLTQPATPMTAIAFEPGHVTLANTWKTNLVFIGLITAVLVAMIPFVNAVIPG